MSENADISVSMTPPWSPSQVEDVDDEELLMLMDDQDPFHQEENNANFPDTESENDSIPEPPVCFQCQGKTYKCPEERSQPKSYLASGQLQKLLTNGPEEWAGITVDLFGETFVAMEELSNPDTLFFLCRKEMDLLLVGNGKHSSMDIEYQNVRLNCRKFWDYVKQFVSFWLPEDFYERQDFLCSLMLNLKDILFHVGQLRELPERIVSSALQSNSVHHYHFHLILDTYWSLVEILHLLSVARNDLPIHLYDPDHVLESDLSADPFSQLVHFILWDFVSFGMAQHNRLQVYEIHRNTPFACGCMEEFLIMLIHLLEHRQLKMAKPSFWVSVNPILRNILNYPNEQLAKLVVLDSDVFPVTPKYICNDPVGFTWWILLHFSNLYKFNNNGIHVSDRTDIADNYYMVQMILGKTLNDQKQAEVVLQSRLISLLNLSSLWQPNISIVTTLAEYFLKKINDHFALPTVGIMRFTSAPKTPRHLLDQCLQEKVAKRPLESDSSFQLFLRILVKHLAPRGQHSGEWNKVKGRFYLKFSKKRVCELSETGLYNFVGLFLTLAATTDLDDVSGKLFELLSAMEMSGVEMSKRLFVWKAMFALILLHVERDKDIGRFAEYMEKNLQNVASRINHGDKSLYSDLWRLVHIYIASTQEIVECSPQLSLSEFKLIGPAFQDLIKSSRDNDMKFLFNFIQAVTLKHRALYKRLQMKSGVAQLKSLRSLSDNLWMYLFSFVKDHAKTGTPPAVLSDVAAGFTLLANDATPSPSTGMKETFAQIFQYFGWNENVNAVVSCRYLGLVMQYVISNEQLRQENPNIHLSLIQAWFRCTLLVSSTNEQMTILTRQILKLQYMKGLSEFGLKEDEALETAVLSFIKALGLKYEGLQGLQVKLEFQKTVKLLLGDVAKHISPVLRNWSPLDQLNVICNIVGHLVRHCAAFLYIRSKADCLLPVLIERLVLPRFLLSSRALPPNFLPALKDNLYLFLQGLASLDYYRDPYVQRKIRDVIQQYLPRFAGKSNDFGTNPIVACLSESCRQDPTPSSVSFRQYVFGILISEFLKINETASHPSANIAWGIVVAVLQESRNDSVKAKDSVQLLEVVLKTQLFSENQGVKQHCLAVTQHLMEAVCKDDTDITTSCSKFVRDFIVSHVAVFEGKVFKVLEPIGVLHPTLLITLIPVLLKSVKDSEKKRNVTVDKNLRFALIQLVEPLGEKGKEVKSQLLQDAFNSAN